MAPRFGDVRPIFGHPATGEREGHDAPPVRPVVGVQLGMDGTALPAPGWCAVCVMDGADARCPHYRDCPHDILGDCPHYS